MEHIESWIVVGIIWLLVFISRSGQPRRGRALSKEEMDAMLKECVGKDKKEVQKIQRRYFYE